MPRRNGDAGDGPFCAEPGDHGRCYLMESGNAWCPVCQTLYARTGTDKTGPILRRRVPPPVQFTIVEETNGYQPRSH